MIDRGAAKVDSRAVYEHVDPAEILENLRARIDDHGNLRDIAAVYFRFSALGLDGFFRFFASGHVDIDSATVAPDSPYPFATAWKCPTMTGDTATCQ